MGFGEGGGAGFQCSEYIRGLDPPWCHFHKKRKVSKARTAPWPRGYAAKLENLERVRGQWGPTRHGYEGYATKR